MGNQSEPNLEVTSRSSCESKYAVASTGRGAKNPRLKLLAQVGQNCAVSMTGLVERSQAPTRKSLSTTCQGVKAQNQIKTFASATLSFPGAKDPALTS